MPKKFFKLPNKSTISIEIPEDATIQIIEQELTKKLFEVDNSFGKNKIVKCYNTSRGYLTEDKINSWEGSHEQAPYNVLYLNNDPEVNLNKEEQRKIHITNHFRIWFSNKPESFMPLFERIVIEESISANPDKQTTLLTDKTILGKQACESLMSWAEKISCNILDINEINPDNETDVLLLMIAKNELAHWRDGKAGNVGIASDIIRLLVVDRGIYFDCDIFVKSSSTNEIDLPSGCLADLLSISLGVTNNDVLSFSSEVGQVLLMKFKKLVLTNYFFPNQTPDTGNAIAAINDIIQQRTQKLEQHDKSQQKGIISKLVTNIAGPFALQTFINNQGINSNFLNYKIVDYLDTLVVNAISTFIHAKKIEATSQLSWLPGNQINNASVLSAHAESFQNYLKELNKPELFTNNMYHL